jgi:hypothetical protein
LDEIERCRNLHVEAAASNADGVSFDVALTVTLDRDAYQKLGDVAKARGNKITTLLAKYIRDGLADCLAADDDGECNLKAPC